MPLGFPISGHRHELWGGRPRPRATPRSRISAGKRSISGTKSGTGASRADLGVRPTETAAPPSFRNYAALDQDSPAGGFSRGPVDTGDDLKEARRSPDEARFVFVNSGHLTSNPADDNLRVGGLSLVRFSR
jgi:hypothetical protein